MGTILPEDYFEKVYAGWLGKVIGIRLGAPIEGWTYDKLRDLYGEVQGYLVDYREFAADDDSNGPMFFLRALEEAGPDYELTPQCVGNALLNYAPYEHGFFWWGGYGISTEHTAYLNLYNGIPAPKSGSAALNGDTMAEQIGGQIFIDVWGLVSPGNPGLAAKYAAAAASATHDKNGIYGGIFIAVCVSLAFELSDIAQIIHMALEYIPKDCEYALAVGMIEAFHAQQPEDWRMCYDYIRENLGYDKYAGACHIIPNAAVIALALLYGEGDFSRSITICNMCGWDTDCNVANVGSILGVMNGLEGIDYEKWRAPIHDFLAFSSVIGSLNIMDIPNCAALIANYGYAIARQPVPERWGKVLGQRRGYCHFELPGSTHAIRTRIESALSRECKLSNSTESAADGMHSLKAVSPLLCGGDKAFIFQKTYYRPADFTDNRYAPSFSPLAYPGQIIHGSAYQPAYGQACSVQLYARDENSGMIYTGEKQDLTSNEWAHMSYRIPPLKGGRIAEIGFIFTMHGGLWDRGPFAAFVDELYVDGVPEFTIDFSKESIENWSWGQKEITQVTRFKGNAVLQDGCMQLSCADIGEVYTGGWDWRDYTVSSKICLCTGERHYVNFRVQGAMRSYAFGFDGAGRIAILKNHYGYRSLCGADFDFEAGKWYTICINVIENTITASIDGTCVLTYKDEHEPYLYGCVGLSVRDGSRLSCCEITVDS